MIVPWQTGSSIPNPYRIPSVGCLTRDNKSINESFWFFFFSHTEYKMKHKFGVENSVLVLCAIEYIQNDGGYF